MNGRVIRTDVFFKKLVELFKGMDRVHVKSIQPTLFCGKQAFYFTFAGTVPYLCVEKACSYSVAYKSELLVGIRSSIIGIKICLHNKAGVIVDDTDSIDPVWFSALCDVREIACIGLPHLTKGVLFEGLAVMQTGITG